MTPELLVSIAAALFAGGSLVFVGISTRHTKKQADASIAQANSAIEQTAIQRQLQEDAAQPYIWADIRPDDRKGGLLVCIIGNSGPTVATDVRVQIDPPMTLSTSGPPLRNTWQPPPLHSIAPGARLQWNLGVAHEEITGDDARPRTLKIDGTGPFGPLPPLEYIVDFTLYRHFLVAAAVSDMNRLTNKVEDGQKAMTDALLKVAAKLPRSS